MGRTQPDAILTADWHIRDDVPVCRTDDFLTAQEEKLQFIGGLQDKYRCPILHAGDLFHSWKASPYCISLVLKHIPGPMYMVAGNHDLPRHTIDLLYKSALETLIQARGDFVLLDAGHWEDDVNKLRDVGVSSLTDLLPSTDRLVALWHVTTYPGGKSLWPGAKFLTAEQILDELSEVDLVVTGHIHETFIVSPGKGRVLVNPGSITRQTVDEIDHKPCVFLWYAGANRVKRVDLPCNEGVISREHIRPKSLAEMLDGNYGAFISSLNEDIPDVSFGKMLEQYMDAKNISKPVRKLIQDLRQQIV